jgi:hypothetical protein
MDHCICKDAGIVVDSLDRHPQRDEVPLHSQQDLHTQGFFFGMPTGKHLEDSNLVSMEAMQWVLLYLSISHDRCY